MIRSFHIDLRAFFTRKYYRLIFIGLLLIYIYKIICPYPYLKLFYISTNSMEPTLKVGSIHIGVKYDQEPQIGDIYCYRYKPASIKDNFASSILLSSSEFLILHRLVNVDSSDCNNYFYYFKGDNNLKMDEPVSKFDILYKIY